MSTSTTRLAFLTIGQAPRHDLSATIEQGLASDIRIRHLGALDGLGRAEVEENFAPDSDSPWLISRLADGNPVTLDVAKIGLRLSDSVESLENDGTDVIVLLCTGEFPHLTTRRSWLIEPDRVMCRTVGGLLSDARAGIIVPLAPQIDEARDKWHFLDQPPVFSAASPYDSDDQALITAATELTKNGARALVLDCMGYSPRHKETLRKAGFTLPVLVSGSIVAGVLHEFI